MSQSSFSLAIAGIEILQDIEGRYNLNILHKASGGAPKHRPGLWVRTDSAKSLVSEVEKTSAHICALVTVVGGISPGTFATQELVVAYAAWISAPFHLKVIRIFLDEAERIRGMSTVDRLVESALALQRHERRIAELAQQQVELKTEINLRQDRMEGEFERLTGMLTQMTVKGYAKAVHYFGCEFVGLEIDEHYYAEDVSASRLKPLRQTCSVKMRCNPENDKFRARSGLERAAIDPGGAPNGASWKKD